MSSPLCVGGGGGGGQHGGGGGGGGKGEVTHDTANSTANFSKLLVLSLRSLGGVHLIRLQKTCDVSQFNTQM